MGNNKNDIGRLMCYLLFNNNEMKNILTRDASRARKEGLTRTFYEGDSTREIVFRLMDTRSFKNASQEQRKRMIYSNYYPEETKVLESVYMDDRRNLCQEFHNRLCASFDVEPTTICFSDFVGMVDADLFYVFDPLSGQIYINTNFTEEEEDKLGLLIYITQATSIHALQQKTNSLYKNYENYTGRERYLCLSMLLTESALAYLSAVGANDERRGLAAANDYSATDIYANMRSYDILERLFKEYGLDVIPEVEDYITEKEDFLLSLSGEYEEDNNDLLDKLELEEDGEEYENDAILNTTLCRDFTMLQEIRKSLINQQTKGDVLRIFLNELNENANEFYESFNFPLDASYKDQYRDFVEFEEAEANESEDEDIPYYNESGEQN